MFPFLLLIAAYYRFVSGTKQHGNAPNTGKRNDCINNAAEHSHLATADPSDRVEAKKTDAAPV